MSISLPGFLLPACRYKSRNFYMPCEAIWVRCTGGNLIILQPSKRDVTVFYEIFDGNVFFWAVPYFTS